MKKMVHIFLTLFTTVLCAQIQNLSGDIMDTSAYLESLTNPIYDKIEGTPYLQETFVPARINGAEETKFVRFNAFDNAIEINLGNGQMMILDKRTTYLIDFLDGSNKVYQTLSYRNDANQIEMNFFERIHQDDRFALYLKERIKLVRGVEDQQAYGGNRPDKFLKINDVYFISNFKSKTPDLLEVPRKKKDFFRFFPKREKEIEKYVKQEKLDVNAPQDIVSIFEYYLEIEKR
jgi:hypothetical protein